MDEPEAKRAVRWIPATLLLLGVLISGYRIVEQDTSAWGGGAAFAMFSRTDHSNVRFVTYGVVIEGRELSIEATDPRPPSESDHLVRPTSDSASMLVAELGSAVPIGADEVVVRLWTVGIEDDTFVAKAVDEQRVVR